MDFRILGPVQVVAGPGAVDLASGRQTALLCRLLIAGNEVVSRDRLIDALWGERPPRSAANALQVHVHALRRALGPERIALEGPGYRLCLEAGELDLERFELLAARGRSELERGDADAAASSFREALELWRGPAYEDVRYEAFAQAEAVRLEELRLATLEDRCDTDLALGRHRDLVPELEALVSEHGSRERLCGQLMLALYRSDRQEAALEAFGARARGDAGRARPRAGTQAAGAAAGDPPARSGARRRAVRRADATAPAVAGDAARRSRRRGRRAVGTAAERRRGW